MRPGEQGPSSQSKKVSSGSQLLKTHFIISLEQAELSRAALSPESPRGDRLSPVRFRRTPPIPLGRVRPDSRFLCRHCHFDLKWKRIWKGNLFVKEAERDLTV